MTLQENQLKMFLALKSPLRCWIIELLKSHRALSSSELASLLNISLGRCCYHLDNLTGLVEQDKKKRYFLSEEGKEAFQLLSRT
ncbi:MAG: helix-turn-helix domain-containing protein [Candidatus Bathyarchaeota archaeon]